jgi:hypothetical protein
VQINDYKSHVVSTETSCFAWIVCHAEVHHFLDNLAVGHSIFLVTSDEIAALLRGDTVPNTITTQDEELVRWLNVYNSDIRLARYDLALATDAGDLLVLEIAEGARQIQVAVDSTDPIHKAARSLNPGVFSLLLRLVIFGKG